MIDWYIDKNSEEHEFSIQQVENSALVRGQALVSQYVYPFVTWVLKVQLTESASLLVG